jgi:hypothetical protein
VPFKENRTIAREGLNLFWATVGHKHPGLPEALGCYIFGIRVGVSIHPWYVGKTEKKSFKFEVIQPHKLLYYQDALEQQPSGVALLYLLPRLTDGGKFRKVWRAGSTSVGRLEGMLIATALSRNPKLLNRLSTKHLTQTVVPGYINEPAGPRSPAAESLAALLGASDKETPEQ